MKLKASLIICFASLSLSLSAEGITVNHRVSIKQPGNPAVDYQLKESGGRLVSNSNLPLNIAYKTTTDGADEVISVSFSSSETVYFNYGAMLPTGYSTADADFYLPGFWYHKNMRSPEGAPSFKTSKSWNVREDRLSSPLSGAFDAKTNQGITVMQTTQKGGDALTTSMEGDVILSGTTSVGYVGFDNETGTTSLSFGYPYEETPRRYIRKLTLAPQVRAFAKLSPGQTITMTWRVHKVDAANYGDFVSKTWEYCYDQQKPQPLQPRYTVDQLKSQLTNYFREAYVGDYALKFFASTGMPTADCRRVNEMQLGFCGRPLLNAFNALQYGESNKDQELIDKGNSVFDSFLKNGFGEKGYFIDFVNYNDGVPTKVHSIRQQSEGVYAVLLYLKYEKAHGRKHAEWEKKVRRVLDNFLTLQNADGSFPRKYLDDNSAVDATGGSTSSATAPLVMAYKYFGDKRYLNAAKRTVDYIDKNIIAKSDYFSSTLDANCEDKEAAISALTATYYLSIVSKGKEKAKYLDLSRKAAYFVLSWYYLWDVPFAQGQMLGDLGFHSRGWGNVSVENNHIDVFAFDAFNIIEALGKNYKESRFTEMANLVRSSMSQLLPVKGHLCGIGKPGFYPEVVQHTTWDYGRNGKGFYNDIFAPGWTVASLWELYSPTRMEEFFK